MFINCKHCGSLVATEPATDLPPERCPRCRGALRSPASPPQVSVASLLRPASPGEALPTDAPAQDRPPQAAETAPASAPAPDAEPRATMPDRVVAPPPAVAAEDTADDAAPAASTSPAPPVLPPGPVTAAAPGAARTSPSFARGRGGARDAHGDRQRRALSVAVVALGLLLGLQIVVADRARLAADPGWRPALTALCSVLRCSLPPWREPAALTLLARDVRPDPVHAGHLLAVATFRNDARWAQAWPRLRLTLSDIHGRTVGTRVFAAEDYLDTTPPAPTLSPGHSAQVRLQLHEPETPAVSFAFDFL